MATPKDKTAEQLKIQTAKTKSTHSTKSPVDKGDLKVGSENQRLDFTKAFKKHLKENGDQELINLCGNVLNEDDSEILDIFVKYINNNKSIKSIMLRFCHVTEEYAKKLFQGLEKNSHLTSLDLASHNYIHIEGSRALAKLLQKNSTLQTLSLEGTAIGPMGSQLLAEGLKHNKGLKILDLSNNDIGCNGTIALAEALKYNTSLTSLKLENNKIGPAGAIALAQALKLNRSLFHLNLSFNRIETEGAIALANALMENKQLSELRLFFCGIGLKGMEALKEALRKNPQFQMMKISFNALGGESQDILDEVELLLEENKKLIEQGKQGAPKMEALDQKKLEENKRSEEQHQLVQQSILQPLDQQLEQQQLNHQLKKAKPEILPQAHKKALSQAEFENIEAQFLVYIQQGKLPSGFESEQKFKEFIEMNLTLEQRTILRQNYVQKLAPHNPFIGPVLQLLPRALLEGIGCALTAGTAAYKTSEDVAAACKAGSVAGVLWMYGRCVHRKGQVLKQFNICKSRFDQFQGILSGEVASKFDSNSSAKKSN